MAECGGASQVDKEYFGVWFVMRLIPYGRQFIDDRDIEAVIDVLKSDFITQGEKVPQFEKAVAEYVGAEYCVVFSSGTAALHMAVAALDIGEGEGITSPISFVATSNSMIYNGLKPKFSDIEYDTGNISVDLLPEAVTSDTRVVIPVHYAGIPVDMKRLRALISGKDIGIIEDAAHAIGSRYDTGEMVGSCKYSDMTVFSFHPVKTITTGEGGAVTTNDGDLYERLLLLRNHGITKEPEKMFKNDGPWYYEMLSLGYNYRMTDIQAALGISQLSKLGGFCERRREIVRFYNERFADLPNIKVPPYGDNICYHIYPIKIDFDAVGQDKAEVVSSLRAFGVWVQVHYIPIYLQPYYRAKYGFERGLCPVAEKFYGEVLSLPLYPSMSLDDAEFTAVKIEEILNGK